MTALLMALFAGGAAAAVSPDPSPGDPHIQTVRYDAQQVVILRVAPNYALTVEFSPDERIENVAVGDSAAWQVTASKSADHLFVKPIQGSLDTNMTVITDSRIYAFELKAAASSDASTPYILRFIYQVAPAAPLSGDLDVPTVVYRLSGDRAVRPISMADDGHATSIVWTEKARIPVVYFVDVDGKETLANGMMRDGRFVIDAVADRYVFRAGGKTAFALRQARRARR